MIAAFYNMQGRWRRQLGEKGAELNRRPECVATALDDQHRPANVAQVPVAPFRRFTWRMQWIAEEHQTGNRKRLIGGSNVRGDPPAHRLATNEERGASGPEMLADAVDHGDITSIEHGSPIRNTPVLLGVGKIERDDVETESR